MKRRVLGVALLAVVAVGCGSSTSTTKTAATTAATVATTAKAASSSAAAASSAAATTAAAAPAAAGATEVKLIEWKIEAPTTLKAGANTFNVNSASGEHELVVIKSDSFASLPKTSGGGVDEPNLAAGAVIGRTKAVKSGKAETLSVNLPAGKYVLICNLGFGPNSHAAKGQNLDVTVA